MATRSPQEWVLLSSDVIRKELAGLAPDADARSPYLAGLYDMAHTHATYEELMRRAGQALGMGMSVVMDASFAAAAHRQTARLVGRHADAPVIEVAVDAPAPLRARRLEQRPQRLASDATVTVLDHMEAAADPWPTAHRLDASGTVENSVATLERIISTARVG